ncbi:hypothetical protein M408DRAFT_326344, partial [Serendipita vermifera MAFF 305830]
MSFPLDAGEGEGIRCVGIEAGWREDRSVAGQTCSEGTATEVHHTQGSTVLL